MDLSLSFFLGGMKEVPLPPEHSPPPRTWIHGLRAPGATGRWEVFEFAHVAKSGLQTPASLTFKQIWLAYLTCSLRPLLGSELGLLPRKETCTKTGMWEAFVWFSPPCLSMHKATPPLTSGIFGLFLCLGRELCTSRL